MKRVLVGFVMVCAVLLTSGVGCRKRQTRVEAGNRDQILHIGSMDEPQDLDPHIVKGVGEHHIIMALLEGLVTEDPKDLHPVPGVAEKWDISPDGLVYTFHLRKNARWSNGDPVTAQDFLKSYQRILTPSLAADYAYMHYPVKNAEAYNKGEIKDFAEVGYKVIDDHTFQIKLGGPTPYFLSLLCHTSWFPVHLPTIEKHGKPYERGNKWTLPENYVGNGPFVLSEWKISEKIGLKKSPTYWDAATVRLNGIYFYPIQNADTEERAFRAGQLHLTEQVPLSKISYYRNTQEVTNQIRIDPYLGNYFYRINTTKAHLKDKRIRLALNLAIDRESLIKNVTKGGQIPAYNFTPPGTAGYTSRSQVTGNVALAKQLLADAGYPDGKGLPPVEILFNTTDTHRVIAEAIQEMWKKNLGIKAELVNQEWKVYLDSQRTKNYQVARSGWIGDYVDPNTFLDVWVTDGANNETGWSNAEYDRLIREAGQTGDQEKRYELFQKAEAILVADPPFLPIYFYTRVHLVQPSVMGWYPNILDNHPYKHVYLEAPRK